jgi:SAM-dependent methyltransferase
MRRLETNKLTRRPLRDNRTVPRNWDEHYSHPDHVDLAPEPLLVQAADLLPPACALDLASGPGRNALHLARLGWQVTAVDSSAVAIGLLRRHAMHPGELRAEFDGWNVLFYSEGREPQRSRRTARIIARRA